MAKPKETFNKKEKEKKRLKQKQEKQEKMAERKAHAKKGKSLEDMMAYIDENGNISDTPPDPRRRVVFKTEDIQIGVPKMEDIPDEPHIGIVSFFNDSKGFGFINEQPSGERIFVHINQLTEPIREGDKVTYEVERGPRGLNATEVKKLQ
ncbi:MAG: cold shock domain-containing protein [Chitinophagaceae bacterium]|nr:cold shock domain-containing protein [Chitinophagaceae bacterium]